MLVLLALAAVIAVAGCTGNSENPSTQPTASPTETPNDFSLTVGQTDPFPNPASLYQVVLNINRNSLTPAIEVEYAGGAGTDRIVTIDVTLYRADDKQVITQTFTSPKQRDVLKFTGSSTPFVEDRIKAVAHYTTGETVVISDALYKYRDTK
ncbi:MAG: hypothetical protein Q4Q53_01750 [Methanocorpusculum sp.]|nr:hypothetical protein [Methanocorpusculum sp.]